MVMHRNRQNALGRCLADNIVIQYIANLARCWYTFTRFHARRFVFFADDIHAKFDAFVTDKDRWPSDQLSHLMLAFATKATVQCVFAFA